MKLHQNLFEKNGKNKINYELKHATDKMQIKQNKNEGWFKIIYDLG